VNMTGVLFGLYSWELCEYDWCLVGTLFLRTLWIWLVSCHLHAGILMKHPQIFTVPVHRN